MQTLRRLPVNMLASMQFLSRLPLWRFVKLDARPDFQAMADTFPLAGAMIGLLAWLFIVPVILLDIPPALTAMMLIACLMLLTGALHEDGLADVADGFWGGHSKARKLEIMRDSAIGTYGTLALMVTTVLRWLLWTAIVEAMTGLELGLMVGVICGLSRGAILVPWIFLQAARPVSAPATAGKDQSGLSIRYGEPNSATGLRALILCLLLFFALPVDGLAACVMAVAASGAILLMCMLARHHIGGHTGDVLGATQQMAELGLLFGFTVAM